ncbi:MAG: glycosyltransferase family 9 protein [Planctomycetes bacterium]|nr:glycosyltransferase family 9 protein [Planctomycetota bacterium]
MLGVLHPEKIALIKPSALGDVLNSLPVLTGLRRLYPAAHISWVVNRAYEPLLRGHPDLDEILPFDRHEVRKNWFSGSVGFVRFLHQMRMRRFDLVIDLQGLFRTGLMTFATAAKHRIGLSSAREGAKVFYTKLVNDGCRTTMHAVDSYWRVIEALGGALGGGGAKTFRLTVDPNCRAWARRILSEHPRPWLAVAVGARWATKRWATEHFAKLIQQSQQEFGGTAIFVGAAEDVNLSRETAAQVSGYSIDLTGRTGLAELAALLAEADAVVSNDSGPLHLAVALGRPVVAPYTCTAVHLHGPYGQERRAVATSVSCAASYRRTCGSMVCMADLTPDKLWPVLREVLSSCQSQRLSA